MSPRRRGFTLIEAMVVTAIVAVLVSLTWPSFGARLTHHRLTAAAEGLAQDMAETRFRAAETGQALHLSFTGAGADWCYAVARSPGCDCRGAQACQLKVVRAGDWPGIHLAQTRDAQFDPALADAPRGGAEFVSNQGERLRVETSPLGRPQICAPTVVGGYRRC